ncbi:MAG: hypothetical protein HQL25_08005 [Candidatus Omnitrophica bacterium]|nr:hypothetical protein [Candidatus Omnitrophota bacterium]
MSKFKLFFIFSILSYLFLPSLAFSYSSEILASQDRKYVSEVNKSLDEWEQIEQRHNQMASDKTWADVEKKASQQNVAPVNAPVNVKEPQDDSEKKFTEDDPILAEKYSREAVLPPSEVKRHTFEVSYALSNYKYEEPNVMKDKGTMNGIYTSYVFRPGPKDPLNNSVFNVLHVEGNANFIAGRIKYDGGYFDGVNEQPLQMKLDKYSVWELRGLLGKEFITNEFLTEIYSGFGWRYLNDEPPVPYNIEDQGNTVVLYQRQQWYYYLPFGFNFTHQLAHTLKFKVNGEYDWMFYGHNISDLKNAYDYLGVSGGPTLEFDQHNGYGFRGSFEVSKTHKNLEFFIRPYFEYWNISASEVNSGFVEPDNNTLQFGSKLGLRF